MGKPIFLLFGGNQLNFGVLNKFQKKGYLVYVIDWNEHPQMTGDRHYRLDVKYAGPIIEALKRDGSWPDVKFGYTSIDLAVPALAEVHRALGLKTISDSGLENSSSKCRMTARWRELGLLNREARQYRHCEDSVFELSKRMDIIIKPDNWRCPSSRPGNIIDMLSRTGLRIVGCKVHRMSVNDALEFYGSVQNALRSKLAPKIGEQAKQLFEDKFKVSLPENAVASLTESVGIPYADDQFSQLIEFMSGKRPEECTEEEKKLQNSQAKCLVLIYEGPNAIAKIRSVLGPTDPSKAPGGTVRRDFGSNVMVNTAHASDYYQVTAELDINE